MDKTLAKKALQSIPCQAGETIRLLNSKENIDLLAPNLDHCISIGLKGENNAQSLSVCPCLVFFSQLSKVKFFANDYLLSLIKREEKWLGKINQIEIRASFKNPYSAWYLCYVENFYKDLGYRIHSDLSNSDSHIYLEDSDNASYFSEFILKFLILEIEKCLPAIKYQDGWLESSKKSLNFLKNLNLSYLLSKEVLDNFLKKYNLEDDKKIVSAMIRRNYKIFMHHLVPSSFSHESRMANMLSPYSV